MRGGVSVGAVGVVRPGENFPVIFDHRAEPAVAFPQRPFSFLDRRQHQFVKALLSIVLDFHFSLKVL
jgi:hypothetical protein